MQLTCAVSVKQLLLLSLRLSSRERKLPEITINNAINSFKTAASILVIQTIAVCECCLIKLLSFFIEKYIYTLALEMASPGNRHCASCIGTLSFPVDEAGVVMFLGCPSICMRTYQCACVIVYIHMYVHL